jgi:PAS domain S-box-containing protein
VPQPEFAKDFVVIGVTEPGDFTPVVRAQRLVPGYGIALPAAQPVSLPRALSGATYAEWTEFRGYVQSAAKESSGLTRIELTTSTGELVAQVRGLDHPEALIGARVQIQGVCDALVNERRQLVGVQLWVPSAAHVRVLDAVPQDVFATPLRSIGSLLQFGAASEFDHRVRLTGTVALHRPGRLLYIEDAEDRLLVLSRSLEPLHPGDQVEVVGFPGHEGVRLIMRDAVYRRTGHGSPPIPTRLETPGAPSAKLDGNTVTIRGRLLDTATTASGIVMQIQSGPTIFPARWSGSALTSVQTGSLVDVTGVYRVEFNEYRRPDAFALELRRAGDLSVIERPPWWTAARIAAALATLLGGTALSIAWLVALMRKNRLLRAAQGDLHRANTQLEARVKERTSALQLEIEERQNSEDILAEERQMLRTLIDNLPLYLYVKNASGRFVISNLPHAQLLGADSGLAVVGRSDFDLYPEEFAQRYREDDQRVLKSGVPLILHEEPSHVRGQPGWFATTKVPLRNRHGQIVGLIGVSQDITDRKRAETEREALQRQLLESSRRAGMAEVATGILHNVGNVLNSVNVSATLAVERVRDSKVSTLTRLAELLQSQAHDLPAFFASDPRGARIPGFVESLGQELTTEQSLLLEELEHLWKKIEHIKDIVAMQQSYATVSGVAEVVDLVDLAEDALRMNASSLARHDVEVVRDYVSRPKVNTERHKVMQILVNLIRNAKQACDETSRCDKRIIVRISARTGHAEISVIDNGVGIPAENLTRIFSHGFTTKKTGHGFGLHSGSLAARDLGGELRAESAGAGQGAAFTLTLPIGRPTESRSSLSPIAADAAQARPEPE